MADDLPTSKGAVPRNVAAIVLLVFGLSQMAGYALQLRALRGIGAASVVAPFPKVFSDVDGVETFASRFVLEYTGTDGKPGRLEVTPEVYSRICGPYNRRNVYGAALSYGPTPHFPKPLFDAVFRYGLTEPGPLREELGLPHGIADLRLRVESKTRGRDQVWTLHGRPPSHGSKATKSK
jgi:hypothetical protein